MRKTTGISLMLLIFLSLCMMIFALLSLSGARADEKLSRKSADRTSEYYAAVTQANKLLALIDDQLALCLTEAETAADPQTAFLESVSSVKNNIPGVTWIEQEHSADSPEPSLSYTVPVTEDQVLLAELSIRYPQHAQDTMYKITAWQIMNTDDWTPDTTQNLYRLTEEG